MLKQTRRNTKKKIEKASQNTNKKRHREDINNNQEEGKKVKSSEGTDNTELSKKNSSDTTNRDDKNNDNIISAKKKIIDKLGPNIIDGLLNSLKKMKNEDGISDVHLNSNTSIIQVVEEEGVLILHLHSDNEEDQKPKYEANYYKRNEGSHVIIQLSGDEESCQLSDDEENYELLNNEGSQKPKYRAQYRKDKKKPSKRPEQTFKEKEKSYGFLPEGLLDKEFEESEEGLSTDEKELYGRDEKYHKKNEKKYDLDDKAIKLGEDLHKVLQFIHKLPTCPPIRDKKIFSRSESYRQAIVNHLMDVSEFLFLKGFRQIDDNTKNLISPDIVSPNHTRVPFIINDENNVKDVLRQLARHIFDSVTGIARSQVAKDILRRKELRFHVEVWKSYVCLQAFCSANLKRNKGETTRSQAKKKIMEEYPDIDLGDLDLILQISPRVYRLLQVSNGNWALLDIFEEITPTFFKSKMKIVTNFDLWINLVRTGTLEDYENGQIYHKRAKQELRDLKIQIIKSYFSDIDEEKLNNIITNDD